MTSSLVAGAIPANSIVASFVNQIRMDPQGIAWNVRIGSTWVSRSKRNVETMLMQLSTGLAACGVQSGDRVAVWAPCCESWVLVDLAAMACGAISAGIPTDIIPHEFIALIDELEPSVLAVDYSRETFLYLFSLGENWWKRHRERGMRLLLLERELEWGTGWDGDSHRTQVGGGIGSSSGSGRGSTSASADGNGNSNGSEVGLGDGDWGRFGPGVLDLSAASLPVMGLENICAMGRERMAALPGEFRNMLTRISDDGPAAIFYTAGEAEACKGAVFTNKALLRILDSPKRVYQCTPGDVWLIFMPMSDVLQRIALWESLLAGDVKIFIEHQSERAGNARLEKSLLEVKPTVLVTGPAFWEKVYARILEAIEDLPVATRAMAYGSLGIARQVARERGKGDQPGVGLALVHQILDRALYGKLRERLGGNLRLAICGGAGLSPWLGGLFNAMGVRIYDGWSMVEAGGMVTLNMPNGVRPETKGKPLQRFSLQIGEDGRIFVSGEGMFSFYWRKGWVRDVGQPETVYDGEDSNWFDTGDVGMLDGDGYLRLLGKADSVFTASDGVVVGVSEIEDRLRTEPYVGHVLVHGHGRPYPVALVALDLVESTRWASMCKDYDGTLHDMEAIAACPELAARFRKVMGEVNKKLPPEGQVKDFKILPRPLDPFVGEVSAGGKMRRKVVEKTFMDVLDNFYK